MPYQGDIYYYLFREVPAGTEFLGTFIENMFIELQKVKKLHNENIKKLLKEDLRLEIKLKFYKLNA